MQTTKNTTPNGTWTTAFDRKGNPRRVFIPAREPKVHVVIESRNRTFSRTKCYKFSTMEIARAFVAHYNLEDKLVDILIW